ncbi:MAG: DUF1704 domain-containing protein [Desulfobacterales bacterium]|jgi:hypothetical protein
MNFAYLQRELDYYKKFVPVNFACERQRFFEHIENNKPYNPVFTYNDRLTVTDYEGIKDALKKEKDKDALIDEFIAVYLVVADIMIAWRQGNYEDLSTLSGIIFGASSEFDISQTIAEYQKLTSLAQASSEIYTDRQIGDKFLEELKNRNWDGWSVEYDEASGGEVSIYEAEKKVVIRTGATSTRTGLECSLTHELDGHAVQAFNAMSHKHYRQWLLSYLGTEKQYEGYATFVVINNLSIPHILSELAYNYALIIATCRAQKSSFYETYRKIFKLSGDKNVSWSAAYKAKRGFQDTASPGCFQKENAYLLGALEILQLVEENKDNYYRLSQGCFPLSAIGLISNKKPKWTSVKDSNKDTQAYFKRKIQIIKK